MKRVAVYFTFGPDGPCLVESVKSIRRVYGPDIGICIYDDHDNPVTPDFINQVRPSIYQQTYFPRHGNLNGPECVAGMLMAFQGAIMALDAEILVKIDSDTMITRDWIDYTCKWSMQGVWFGTRAVLAGLCYAMDASTPDVLMRAINGRNVWEGPCPEDATMSMLSLKFGPYGIKATDCAYGAKGSIAVGYGYGRHVMRHMGVYAKYPIVTFGNRKGIGGDYSDDERRLIAAKKMEAFNNYLETRLQSCF